MVTQHARRAVAFSTFRHFAEIQKGIFLTKKEKLKQPEPTIGFLCHHPVLIYVVTSKKVRISLSRFLREVAMFPSPPSNPSPPSSLKPPFTNPHSRLPHNLRNLPLPFLPNCNGNGSAETRKRSERWRRTRFQEGWKYRDSGRTGVW